MASRTMTAVAERARTAGLRSPARTSPPTTPLNPPRRPPADPPSGTGRQRRTPGCKGRESRARGEVAKPWSPSSFRQRLIPGRRVSRRSRLRRRRACQRAGVEVADLVDALGELPAVRGALVTVVVDGVVRVRATVPPVDELTQVRPAGRGVALQPDRARVRGLHEVVRESLPPFAH